MVMGTLQIGKNGMPYNFNHALTTMFKHHNIVKISVLKSARGEGKEAKDSVKEYARKISQELGNKYAIRIIGFTIVVKKMRKPQKISL